METRETCSGVNELCLIDVDMSMPSIYLAMNIPFGVAILLVDGLRV